MALDWSALRQAYGSAEGIPDLLDRASMDTRAGHVPESAWFEVWSSLCHQGTVYTASYAATPRLVEIARTRSGRSQIDPLLLIGCIELGRLEGGPAIPLDLQSAYSQALDEARALLAAALEAEHGALEHKALSGSLAALAGRVEEANTILDAEP